MKLIDDARVDPWIGLVMWFSGPVTSPMIAGRWRIKPGAPMAPGLAGRHPWRGSRKGREKRPRFMETIQQALE